MVQILEQFFLSIYWTWKCSSISSVVLLAKGQAAFPSASQRMSSWTSTWFSSASYAISQLENEQFTTNSTLSSLPRKPVQEYRTLKHHECLQCWECQAKQVPERTDCLNLSPAELLNVSKRLLMTSSSTKQLNPCSTIDVPSFQSARKQIRRLSNYPWMEHITIQVIFCHA